MTDQRIKARLTLDVDCAAILIFHPTDLQHAIDRPIGWYADARFYADESAAGRLIVWSTGSDGVYDVRMTDVELTDRERSYAGPEWSFPLNVHHGRVYVDNADAIPGAAQFDDPYKNGTRWVDVPNGAYRVTVTGIDWSIEPDIAEDGSDGLPDFVVFFEPADSSIPLARRAPSIRPFKNEVADDTPY